MQPTIRVTAVDSAIQEMRHEIVSGAWPIGSRIPSEQELGGLLGISRAPIREATRALVHAGLLTSRQGDGTYVIAKDETRAVLGRRLSRSDVLSVLEVRRGLDLSAARLASLRRSGEALAEIERHLTDRGIALRARDREAFAKADAAFHLAVATAAENPLLSEFYLSIAGRIEDSVDCDQSFDFNVHAPEDDHSLLFIAIRDQDPMRATEIALQIIDEQEQTLGTSEGRAE